MLEYVLRNSSYQSTDFSSAVTFRSAEVLLYGWVQGPLTWERFVNKILIDFKYSTYTPWVKP